MRSLESPVLDERSFWSEIAMNLAKQGCAPRIETGHPPLPAYLGCGIVASKDERQFIIGRFRHFSLDEVLKKDLLSLDTSFYSTIIERMSSAELLEEIKGIDAVVLDFRPSPTSPHQRMYRLWNESHDETVLIVDLRHLLDLSLQDFCQALRDMKGTIEKDYHADPSREVMFVTARYPDHARLGELLSEQRMVLRFAYNADPEVCEKERRFLALQKKFITVTDPKGMQSAMRAVGEQVFGVHDEEMTPFYRDLDEKIMSVVPTGFAVGQYLLEQVIGEDVLRNFGVKEQSPCPLDERRGLHDLFLDRYPKELPTGTMLRLTTTDIPPAIKDIILVRTQDVYEVLTDAKLFFAIRGVDDQYLHFRQEVERIIGCIDPTRLPEEKITYGTLTLEKDEIAVWTPTGEAKKGAVLNSYYPWGVPPGGELNFQQIKMLEEDPSNDYLSYYGLPRSDYTYVPDQLIAYFTLPESSGYDGRVRAEPHIRQSILRLEIPDGSKIVFLHCLKDLTGWGLEHCLEPVASVDRHG